MFGVAWLMQAETITPLTFKHHAGGAPGQMAHPVHARAATTDATIGALGAVSDVSEVGAVGAVGDRRPAAIINEPGVATSPLSGGLAAWLGWTPAAQHPAVGAAGTRAKVGQATRPTDQVAAHKIPAALRARPTAAAAAVAAVAAARQHRGALPTAATDADVTLLTALVAHAAKPAHPKNLANAAPERSRDVLERVDDGAEGGECGKPRCND